MVWGLYKPPLANERGCDMNSKAPQIDKVIDFCRQLLASILRSRIGALTQLATLLRFQPGTKGFERRFNKLVPLMKSLEEAYQESVKASFPKEGLRLGIFDDSSIKKTGKTFPKQKKHYDSSNNEFYNGMKILSSMVCQKGKLATVSSVIVGEEDNKLEVAKEKVDYLVDEFLVEMFLFDSWYCKQPLLNHIIGRGKLFISRLRKDTKTVFGEDEERLDNLARSIEHKTYEQIKIKGKTYWVVDLELDLKAYGKQRVILSKESRYEKPIFLVTNAYKLSAQFIVKLYLKRFSIEVFFKDAKQHLNLETFLCRDPTKWDLHLQLTNLIHWAIQKKNSISHTIRAIREDIQQCLLFINQNPLINQFFEELRKKCPT